MLRLFFLSLSHHRLPLFVRRTWFGSIVDGEGVYNQSMPFLIMNKSFFLKIRHSLLHSHRHCIPLTTLVAFDGRNAFDSAGDNGRDLNYCNPYLK